MQLLQLRLKLVSEWIIHKKQEIANLVTNNLPIYKSISIFVEQYIQYMKSIIDVTNKAIQELGRDTQGNQAKDFSHKDTILYELYELIRKKEEIGVQEWTEKLEVLQRRYRIGVQADITPFPDIFNDIDQNVEYYTRLRHQLSKARQKAKQKQGYIGNNYNTSPNIFRKYNEYNQDIDRNNNHKKAENNIKKMDIDANQYDAQDYKQKLQSLRKRVKIFDTTPRQSGRIRVSPKTTKPEEYEPYKLVNPKYSPHKGTGSRVSTEPANSPYLTMNNAKERNEKYKQYKAELLREMNNQILSQFTSYPSSQKHDKQDRQDWQEREKARELQKLQFMKDMEIERQKQRTKLKIRELQNMIEKQSKQKQMLREMNKKQNQKYSEYSNQDNRIQRRLDFDKKYQTDRYQQPKVSEKYWSDQKNQFQRNQPKNPLKKYQSQTKNQVTRKYQYLFEQDRQLPLLPIKVSPRDQNIRKTPKKEPRIQPYTEPFTLNPKINPQYNINEDSLEQQDQLGSELEVDMPVLFKERDSNLEELLANSLMSSKKWESPISSFSDGSHSSETDSLEENYQIRQTGKFKEPVYTDEDDTYDYTPEKQQNQYRNPKMGSQTYSNKYDKPLTIEKQISSESKDLNMSFGKN